jgi:hypothetical protein
MPSEPVEHPLLIAPDHPFGSDGSPRFGTFRGDLSTCDLEPTARRLKGRLGARLGVKRWQWFGAFDDGIAIGGAVVSLGYASNMFAWVFDRRGRAFRWERQETRGPNAADVAATPRPGSSSRAGDKIVVTRPTDSTWNVRMDWRDLQVAIDGRATAPAATAICPVRDAPGALHTTRKAACIEASGRIAWSGGEHRLGPDAFLLLDHSHGLPARHTNWRWVMAQGTDRRGETVALNAVSGFNEGLENVVWIGGEPRPLGKVNIAFDPDHADQPWVLYGDDLELELQVEGVRSHDVNLGLVASRYDQPIGTWRGIVHGHDVTMVGVAEDHAAVW